MRSPSDIRRALLTIRDRNRMPYALICERSRCTHQEIMLALKLEADQETLHRLDAFLDMPKLHVVKRESQLMWEIERMSYELYKEYGVRQKIRTEYIRRMPEARQARVLEAMEYQGKRCLVQMMYVETGFDLKVPDGQGYWQFKAKCVRRQEALRSGDGDADYFPRHRPVA